MQHDEVPSGDGLFCSGLLLPWFSSGLLEGVFPRTLPHGTGNCEMIEIDSWSKVSIDVSLFLKPCLLFRGSVPSKSEPVKMFPANTFSVGNH